jgi:hypothetical protein
VVAVNLDTERAEAEKFLADIHSDLPVVFDTAQTLPEALGVTTMPTSFLVGRDGKIEEVYEGFDASDESKIESRIAALAGAAHAK